MEYAAKFNQKNVLCWKCLKRKTEAWRFKEIITFAVHKIFQISKFLQNFTIINGASSKVFENGSAYP